MQNSVMKFRSLLGLLALPALCLSLAAQDQPAPGAEKAPPAAKADAEGQTYEGELISAQPDANRIMFRVTQGGSTRVFNMTVADDAKLRKGEADVTIRSLAPNTPITVTTRRADGLEQVASLTVKGEATGRGAPMGTMGEPTGGKQTMAFPTGDRASSLLVLDTNAPDSVRVGEGFDFQITVTNITKNVTLEDVHVRQHLSENLEARRHEGGNEPAPKEGEDKKGDEAHGPHRSGSPREVEWMIPGTRPGPEREPEGFGRRSEGWDHRQLLPGRLRAGPVCPDHGRRAATSPDQNGPGRCHVL